MRHSKHSSARAAAALAVLAATACSGAIHEAAAQDVSSPASARADSGRRPHTAADVAFMSGMIVHHAQAVQIAGWAPTHDAGAALRRLCERIVVGQQDEIAILTRWLTDRGEPVPMPDAHRGMPGMDHAAMMPGMLTDEQLAQLDSARGTAFDRLFLTRMIAHHRGALVMVDQLLAAQGAGQDQTVFRIASDVHADQSTEIHRMQQMLASLPPEGQGP